MEENGTKSHGLLFKGAMIRALVAERKTATRRPITPVNTLVQLRDGADWIPATRVREMIVQKYWMAADARAQEGFLRVTTLGLSVVLRPRVVCGDEIWAKETWRDDPAGVTFAADGPWEGGALPLGHKWKSAMLMPRKVARIVRRLTLPTIAQPLGAMSPGDVAAEGFPLPDDDPEGPAGFDDYWRQIHGAPARHAEYVWCYRGMVPT